MRMLTMDRSCFSSPSPCLVVSTSRLRNDVSGTFDAHSCRRPSCISRLSSSSLSAPPSDTGAQLAATPTTKKARHGGSSAPTTLRNKPTHWMLTSTCERETLYANDCSSFALFAFALGWPILNLNSRNAAAKPQPTPCKTLPLHPPPRLTHKKNSTRLLKNSKSNGSMPMREQPPYGQARHRDRRRQKAMKVQTSVRVWAC